jgi:amino acid transporter
MYEKGIEVSPVKPKLGLLGATMNAMALIAPGAFLWITYQLQAAATAPNGTSAANDIWAGIVVALIVAFLTALSYAQLAKIYPEAGFASCCYFAERAFLDKEGENKRFTTPYSLARIAKLVTGWAAHLFYWVYPGIMVAMMATMIGYIYTQFTGHTLSSMNLIVIGTVFAIVTGYVAFRGISGSTVTSIWINIIQLVTLVIFSGLAIGYRILNPQHAAQWSFSGAWDVVRPHTFQGVLVQSTLAILILVGFESCTALAAETKEPENTIPKAIILSLIIQGLFAYLFEYFAAGFMISDKLAGTASGVAVNGIAAAAASGAPIGDLTKLIGDSMLGGIGFGLMITMAVTVAIAIIGTTLSCMNTAVRVTCGMAEHRELPSFLSFLHGEFVTPHMAIVVLVIISSIIAAVGVQSVVGLTGITLASNLGTFVLYGLTCFWTIVAFKRRSDFNILKHGIIPALGIITNVIMTVAIIYLYIIGNADAKAEARICFIIAGAWAVISLAYIGITTFRKTNSLKMVSAMIRPESLNILVAILKDEEMIEGMTVTKVKGFGKQKGHTDTGPQTSRISFVPKVRVDVVVREWDVPHIMAVMRDAANTGQVGDGKIFVLDATEAMRVRTGEKGIHAV